MADFKIPASVMLALVPELRDATKLDADEDFSSLSSPADAARWRMGAVKFLMETFSEAKSKPPGQKIKTFDFSKKPFSIAGIDEWDPLKSIYKIDQELGKGPGSGPREFKVRDEFEPIDIPAEILPTRSGWLGSYRTSKPATEVVLPGLSLNPRHSLSIQVTCPNCKHPLLVTSVDVMASDVTNVVEKKK
jgi:hypothetical protein